MLKIGLSLPALVALLFHDAILLFLDAMKPQYIKSIASWLIVAVCGLVGLLALAIPLYLKTKKYLLTVNPKFYEQQ